MDRLRVMPVLLADNTRLVKGKQFANHKYVGDPINALRIFNDKEVDELIFFDITASKQKRGPNFDYLSEISSEAFFPLAYGGGITSVAQIERLMRLGIEKVVLGTSAFHDPQLVRDAVSAVGSQSVVVSIDYRKTFFRGVQVYTASGTVRTAMEPKAYALAMEDLGAGELIITNIENEGTGRGYDLVYLSELSSCLSVPIVASGGANNTDDFIKARDIGHVQAVSASSMFLFYGPHRAVLINYPSYEAITQVFEKDRN